jgi:hypothetical protein
VNVGEIPLELGCDTPPVVMHHHRFSRTPGSTAYDVDLFHATNLENSLFGAGPVNLIHEGFVPRKGSRVKAKLQLDAIFSPAITSGKRLIDRYFISGAYY